MEISGNLWNSQKFMENFLEMSGKLWTFSWKFMEIRRHLQIFVEIRGNVWKFMDIFMEIYTNS